MSEQREPGAGTPGAGAAVIILAAATMLLGITAARWSIPHGSVDASAQALRQRAVDGWPDMRIDINAADAPALTLLPGIGPTLADRIVEDRRAHGPYGSVDELARVPRIGPATVDRLRPFAVGTPPR